MSNLGKRKSSKTRAKVYDPPTSKSTKDVDLAWKEIKQAKLSLRQMEYRMRSYEKPTAYDVAVATEVSVDHVPSWTQGNEHSYVSSSYHHPSSQAYRHDTDEIYSRRSPLREAHDLNMPQPKRLDLSDLDVEPVKHQDAGHYWIQYPDVSFHEDQVVTPADVRFLNNMEVKPTQQHHQGAMLTNVSVKVPQAGGAGNSRLKSQAPDDLQHIRDRIRQQKINLGMRGEESLHGSAHHYDNEPVIPKHYDDYGEDSGLHIRSRKVAAGPKSVTYTGFSEPAGVSSKTAKPPVHKAQRSSSQDPKNSGPKAVPSKSKPSANPGKVEGGKPVKKMTRVVARGGSEKGADIITASSWRKGQQLIKELDTKATDPVSPSKKVRKMSDESPKKVESTKKSDDKRLKKLPSSAKAILNDLHQPPAEVKSSSQKAKDPGTRTKSPSAKKRSRPLTTVPEEKDEKSSKVKHYDQSEARDYIKKQRSDRKRKEQEEARARQEAERQRKQNLKALQQHQLEAARAAAVAAAGKRPPASGSDKENHLDESSGSDDRLQENETFTKETFKMVDGDDDDDERSTRSQKMVCKVAGIAPQSVGIAPQVADIASQVAGIAPQAMTSGRLRYLMNEQSGLTPEQIIAKLSSAARQISQQFPSPERQVEQEHSKDCVDRMSRIRQLSQTISTQMAHHVDSIQSIPLDSVSEHGFESRYERLAGRRVDVFTGNLPGAMSAPLSTQDYPDWVGSKSTGNVGVSHAQSNYQGVDRDQAEGGGYRAPDYRHDRRMPNPFGGHDFCMGDRDPPQPTEAFEPLVPRKPVDPLSALNADPCSVMNIFTRQQQHARFRAYSEDDQSDDREEVESVSVYEEEVSQRSTDTSPASHPLPASNKLLAHSDEVIGLRNRPSVDFSATKSYDQLTGKSYDYAASRSYVDDFETESHMTSDRISKRLHSYDDDFESVASKTSRQDVKDRKRSYDRDDTEVVTSESEHESRRVTSRQSSRSEASDISRRVPSQSTSSRISVLKQPVLGTTRTKPKETLSETYPPRTKEVTEGSGALKSRSEVISRGDRLSRIEHSVRAALGTQQRDEEDKTLDGTLTDTSQIGGTDDQSTQRSLPPVVPAPVPREPRYSPAALFQTLGVQLNFMDSLEASLRQLNEIDRAHSVGLNQQETVSLAQILRARTEHHSAEIEALSRRAKEEQFLQQAASATESAMKALEKFRQEGDEKSKKELLKSQKEVAQATARATEQLYQFDPQRFVAESVPLITASVQAAVSSIQPPQLHHAPVENRSTQYSMSSSIARQPTSYSYTSDFTDTRAKPAQSSSETSTSTHRESSVRTDYDIPSLPRPAQRKASSDSIATDGGATADDASLRSQSTVSTESGVVPESPRSKAGSVIEEIASEHSFDTSFTEEDVERSMREVLPSEGQRRKLRKERVLIDSTIDASSPDIGHHLAFHENAFSHFTSELLREYLKEEELRHHHQEMLLNLRKAAIDEKISAENEWYEQLERRIPNKGKDDKYPVQIQQKKKALRKLKQQKAQIEQEQEAHRRQHQYVQSQLKKIQENKTVDVKRKDKASEQLSDTTPRSVQKDIDRFKVDERHLTAREHRLRERRRNAQDLVKWTQRLDLEEKEVESIERTAYQKWKQRKSADVSKSSVATTPRGGTIATESKIYTAHDDAKSGSSDASIQEEEHLKTLRTQESSDENNVTLDYTNDTFEPSTGAPVTQTSGRTPGKVSTESESEEQSETDHSDVEGHIRALREELERKTSMAKKLQREIEKKRLKAKKKEEAEELKRKIEEYEVMIGHLTQANVELAIEQEKNSKPQIKQPRAKINSTDSDNGVSGTTSPRMKAPLKEIPVGEKVRPTSPKQRVPRTVEHVDHTDSVSEDIHEPSVSLVTSNTRDKLETSLRLDLHEMEVTRPAHDTARSVSEIPEEESLSTAQSEESPRPEGQSPVSQRDDQMITDYGEETSPRDTAAYSQKFDSESSASDSTELSLKEAESSIKGEVPVRKEEGVSRRQEVNERKVEPVKVEEELSRGEEPADMMDVSSTSSTVTKEELQETVKPVARPPQTEVPITAVKGTVSPAPQLILDSPKTQPKDEEEEEDIVSEEIDVVYDVQEDEDEEAPVFNLSSQRTAEEGWLKDGEEEPRTEDLESRVRQVEVLHDRVEPERRSEDQLSKDIKELLQGEEEPGSRKAELDEDEEECLSEQQLPAEESLVFLDSSQPDRPLDQSATDEQSKLLKVISEAEAAVVKFILGSEQEIPEDVETPGQQDDNVTPLLVVPAPSTAPDVPPSSQLAGSEAPEGPSPSAGSAATVEKVTENLLNEAIRDILSIKKKKEAKQRAALSDEGDDDDVPLPPLNTDQITVRSVDDIPPRPGTPDILPTNSLVDDEYDFTDIWADDDPLSEVPSSPVAVKGRPKPAPPSPVKYVVPNSREEVCKVIDLTTEVYWQKRRFGESWHSVPEPSTLLTADELSADRSSKSKRAYKRMVFHLTGQHLRDLYADEDQPEQLPWQKLPLRRKEPPNTLTELQPIVGAKVLQSLGFEKAARSAQLSATRVIGRRKRDHVDRLLIQELREEEPEWTDYHKDELDVKMQLADTIFELLLIETGQTVMGAYKKRQRLQRLSSLIA